jgi:ferrous iron transport protein A
MELTMKSLFKGSGKTTTTPDAASETVPNVASEAVSKAEEKAENITLLDAEPGKTYIIKEINTEDDEMNSFLFRLGCYPGEPITLISKKRKSCIVVIKDGRYSLDNMLAEAILI